MKKILSNRKSLFVFWVLLLGLITWPLLLPGYFSHHDDLQVMRIVEMRKCLEDGQIPCRWVPDMGYGNGYPLFNYYSILPYYIGASFSFLAGYILAAKLLFAIPLILGLVSMYLLAKELFSKTAAILAAVLYSFAPYKALDIYVRGAVAESFALAFIPLTFYFVLKLIKEGRTKYLALFSISLSLFLLSHNIMTILFIPILLSFIMIFLAQKKWKMIPFVTLGLSLGIGLSAFFILPAYFEKDLVQIDNLIRLDLNFRAHFVTLNQLFIDRFWGYGASSIGPNDTISFQIGWPHWWIVVVSSVLSLFNLIWKRKLSGLFALWLIIIFLLSIFMTHIKSAFIWEKIEILKFTQFPWRFLSVAIFTSSLLGAYIIQSFKENKKLLIIFISLTVILNWSYFRPEKFYFDLTDQEKLSGYLWEEQQRAAILDYLPQTAVQPHEAASGIPQVISGKAVIEGFENKSNRWQFQIKVNDQATVEVPTFDFPGWEVRVNNQKIDHSNKNYLGRISISFDKAGDYSAVGRFKNTWIRTISNIISIVSLIVLIWIFYGKREKVFK
ncbi:glycosyltransferase family 39 protein [Candidatus Daviesbacteria bacterium]|nr:glycosyltransferase family 39 protein [Candidatus Daviesbacteria bacterium]